MNSQIVLTSLGQVSGTIIWMLAGFIIVELIIYAFGKKIIKNKNTQVAMLVFPAFIGLGLLLIFPLLYEVMLAFSNMNLFHFRNPDYSLLIGLKNFARVFTKPILQTSTFFPVLLRTFLWTSQVLIHASFGMMLALLLNRPGLKFKNVYRAILILPWAMPQVISALTWRSEFNFEYGFFNIILSRLGMEGVQWKADIIWNFVAMIITNVWLGVPFMMVIALGGLQSISTEFYEAAHMDGASGWTKFTNITLPLMKPVLAPSVMLGIIWTFNNFNIPYFINEMNLETSDILVTALFRAAFNFNQYGFSAAFALVIFALLFSMTLIYVRWTGALKGVTD
ncbi:MAG: sugar ABC transporter permease [Spirochaetaceae bacterium]|nr:sugar ABC transporter permease [Spirochaetaceae bacterium]